MGWEALSAIGSIAAAVILLVGSMAAVIQLKHIRLANQLESYVTLSERFTSSQMIEAREYVESLDVSDQEVLQKHFQGHLDERIMLIGGFYQTVALLINYEILDRALFNGFINSAFTVWKKLRPIAYELRARHPENPRWLDVEYLVYSSKGHSALEHARRYYSREFRERVGLDSFVYQAQQMWGEASTTIGPYPPDVDQRSTGAGNTGA